MAKNVSLDSMDQKLALAKRCSHEGAKAGAKAAVFATVATAIPTYACGKISPWARAHLNPTAKALIVSTVLGWHTLL
ncbi:early nodulin-93-like [Solanum verrucosum]|uniref:early nodulin-93-like n=1 Tax=Solanum verrucosum TaxID=315347 RepID=UPI0020D002E1|nr:early nodulin-93-like [Solanum verrucosum]